MYFKMYSRRAFRSRKVLQYSDMGTYDSRAADDGQENDVLDNITPVPII